MIYSITFKLDSRKDVYKSKRVRSGEEPYFPISALIKLVDGNNKELLHFTTGYSAQRSAWYANPSEAGKGDKRQCGVRRNCFAKHGTKVVQFSEVNKMLDNISMTLYTIAQKNEILDKSLVKLALERVVGKNRKLESASSQIPSMNQEITETDYEKFWRLVDIFCTDHTVSEGRNKTRYNAMNHLRRFEQNRGERIVFARCNAKLMYDFQTYLKNDIGEGDYSDLSHRTRKKNINTTAKILATVKSFFRWCYKLYDVTEFGNIDAYTVPTPQYGDPITITQEEKRQLFEAIMPTKELELYRDIFYFQCSIGARVSDYFKLKYKHINYEEEKVSVNYIPHKTKNFNLTPCRIPLTKRALEILNKYKPEEVCPDTPLFAFPRHSQTYNENLKRVFREANLCRVVMVADTDGNLEPKQLWEIAQSKWGRSAFIDTLVANETTDNIISTMSGHIPGSKAFHRYHNSMKRAQQNKAIESLD